jgi:hypothetical protein
MGRISDRSRENLAMTDKAIVMARGRLNSPKIHEFNRLTAISIAA